MPDRVYDLQKQLELLAQAMLGTTVVVQDYDDMANALHAKYAQIASVFVPDYSISEAWTERLQPFTTVGYWRIPNQHEWNYYSHGQWYPLTAAQVIDYLRQGSSGPGTTPGFYDRTIGQSTLIMDPNDPTRPVPNPVFLVPHSVQYF